VGTTITTVPLVGESPKDPKKVGGPPVDDAAEDFPLETSPLVVSDAPLIVARPGDR
jgi:hypothetical protein